MIAETPDFRETHLSIPATTSFESWRELGNTLQRMERSIQWWVGDWLNFGEERFPDRYLQAVEETGYSHSALRNMSYVARCFPVSSRDDTLAWSHYRALAPLPEKQRFEKVQQLVENPQPVRKTFADAQAAKGIANEITELESLIEIALRAKAFRIEPSRDNDQRLEAALSEHEGRFGVLS